MNFPEVVKFFFPPPKASHPRGESRTEKQGPGWLTAEALILSIPSVGPLQPGQLFFQLGDQSVELIDHRLKIGRIGQVDAGLLELFHGIIVPAGL